MEVVVVAVVAVVLGAFAWRRARQERARRALGDRRFEAMRRFVPDPSQPFTAAVLRGTPEVRIEERPGGWLFVARWPADLPMAPRDPERRAWTPQEPLFATTCRTVTPAALAEGEARQAVFSIDALRLPWTDPDVPPETVVAALRRLWALVVDPPLQALAYGVVHNGALRAANLRALAARDPEWARRMAKELRPADGVWLYSEALAVAGDVPELLRYFHTTPEAWLRVAAVHALGEILDPDPLLPLAEACAEIPEAAAALAERVASHRTPARDAFAVQAALGGFAGWPEPAARRLGAAALAAAPRDEAVLVALLRTPGPAAEKALARLATHGTVASVPALRAAAADGELPTAAVEAAVAAIQSRVTGPRGALALAEVQGGGLSVAAGDGALSPPEEPPEGRG